MMMPDSPLKNCAQLVAAGLGLLLCFGGNAIAQQPSASVPIVVQFSEIDRCNVSLVPAKFSAKIVNSPMVCLPFKGDGKSEVDTLVGGETNLNRPLWVADGDKIVVKGTFGGRSVFCPYPPGSEQEAGVCLRFETDEEAQKVKLQLEATQAERMQWDMNHLDERIQGYGKQLDDPKLWIP